MRDMAHSICLIKLWQITMRKQFDCFVSDYLKGVFKEISVVGMRSATYPTQKYVLIDSTHFAKSSDSEIFELSENSEFSISPEKVISRQN